MISLNEISFLGHHLSADGSKPDQKKIEAIINMQNPSNKNELQRFLGMVNYLGKFVPNLSTVTSPLRQLLQKDTIFSMEKPQLEAIALVKQLITSYPVLQFYDPEASLRLRADASADWLGAIL